MTELALIKGGFEHQMIDDPVKTNLLISKPKDSLPLDAMIGKILITHLIFDRLCPLFREIDAYQRHRIEKLKKLHGRGF